MIIEGLTSVLSIAYLIMILEILFFAPKNLMRRQRAFEGRLLFFIYSLLVYYKNFKFNIFIWDTFLNQPIISAYNLLNSFLTNFFGISIAESPWFLLVYLVPAGFVYHFVRYWFDFGFGDEKIAQMVSLVALVLFISSSNSLFGGVAGSIGLIGVGKNIGVPTTGFFTTGVLTFLIDKFPTFAIDVWSKDLPLITPFLSLFGDNKLFPAFIIFSIIFILAFLFVIGLRGIMKFIFFKVQTKEKTKTSSFIFSILIFVSAIVLSIVLGVISLGSNLIFNIFLGPLAFLGVLTLIIVFSELLVYVAFYMVIKDINMVVKDERISVEKK